MFLPASQQWKSKRGGGAVTPHAASLLNGTHYLLRFDDICPTMNWDVWEAIETHLVRNDVRPILAVVPDNQDPKLIVETPRPDFWQQVRKWQAMGYTIALHGYQHRYVNSDPGMIGLTPQSEFAGLSRGEQEDKLKKGLTIFTEQGVRADAWVAPSHSFDATTVEILGKLGISVISDGLGCRPFTDEAGMTWVPQQLWSFQSMSTGVWTICNHHNSWTDQKVEWFGETLAVYSKQMTDMTAILEAFADRRRSLADFCQAYHRLIWRHRIRPRLSEFIQNLAGFKPASR
jgi:hypothetical protein